MKGILGKKLGMSQVFDPETGQMTPVTVIEAGPCPVVQVKTVDTDGYDAVQLAFDAVAERKVSRPEIGHLAKAGVGPHRHLVEVRGHIGLAVGEIVHHGEHGLDLRRQHVEPETGHADRDELGSVDRETFHASPRTPAWRKLAGQA